MFVHIFANMFSSCVRKTPWWPLPRSSRRSLKAESPPTNIHYKEKGYDCLKKGACGGDYESTFSGVQKLHKSCRRVATNNEYTYTYKYIKEKNNWIWTWGEAVHIRTTNRLFGRSQGLWWWWWWLSCAPGIIVIIIMVHARNYNYN